MAPEPLSDEILLGIRRRSSSASNSPVPDVPFLPNPFEWSTTARRLRSGAILLVFWATPLLLARPAGAQDEPPTTRIQFLKYDVMATTVALSPDGQYIAIGTRHGPDGGSQVVLWDRTAQTRVRSASFPTDEAPTAAFDRSGTRLAVAPRRDSVRLWSLDGERTVPLRRGPVPARAVAVGPRGHLAAAGPAGVRVWPDGPTAPPKVLDTDGPVRGLAFSRATPAVAVAEGPDRVALWNYPSDSVRRISLSSSCPGTPRDIAVPDESGRVYVTTDGPVPSDPDCLCVLEPGRDRRSDRVRRRSIRNVEPLRDERVVYSRGRYVYALDLQDRSEELLFESKYTVKDLSYANGRLVVANADVLVLEM